MSILHKDFNCINYGGNHHSLYVDESYYIKRKTTGGFSTCKLGVKLDEEDDTITFENDNVICKFSNWWYSVGYWDNCNVDNYPELKPYHDKIIQYLEETENIRKELSMPSSISIGLISKPGMGKSTLIRMICTTLKKNINIVENKDGYELDNVDGILVVEDYDRFNEENKISFEHELNNLIYTGTEIPIIFYTSNTTLQDNLDLIFRFEQHSNDTYKRSIELLFNDSYTNTLLDIFNENKLSMREVNQLLCAAYCSNASPVDYIKDNIGKIRPNDNKYSNGIIVEDEWDYF